MHERIVLHDGFIRTSVVLISQVFTFQINQFYECTTNLYNRDIMILILSRRSAIRTCFLLSPQADGGTVARSQATTPSFRIHFNL